MVMYENEFNQKVMIIKLKQTIKFKHNIYSTCSGLAYYALTIYELRIIFPAAVRASKNASIE